MHVIDGDYPAPEPPREPSPRPWPAWDGPLLFMLGPDIDAIP